MTKSQDRNLNILNILGTKRAFKMTQKACFIIFEELSLKQIKQFLLEGESLTLTQTKSVICQLDAIFSPFQLLNMLPFQIRLEQLKLIYYSLISNFSKYCLKLAQFASFSYLQMYLPL